MYIVEEGTRLYILHGQLGYLGADGGEDAVVLLAGHAGRLDHLGQCHCVIASQVLHIVPLDNLSKAPEI